MSGGRKHRRHVTPAEAELWRAVTRQMTPLRPEPQSELALEPPKTDVASLAPVAKKLTERSGGPAAPRKAAAPPKTNAPIADFEHKRAKRLSSGRLPIEARLDLHGLRQDEARAALLGFLSRAQAQGLRHVKVITGKGKSKLEPEKPRPFSLFEENRRGVLREQVPRWLGEAMFRVLVVSFTVAGPGHGGGGALYVQIRKRPLR